MVELLVTMAIIGLLAALLVPAVRGSLDKARVGQLTSNLRQVGASLLSYSVDNEGRFPLAGGFLPYVNAADPAAVVSWQQALDSYVGGDRRVFFFPNTPTVNSEVQPILNTYGFFLGARAAYIDNNNTFAAVNLYKIRAPSSYILGGEVRYSSFSAADADRDNYTSDPAFDGKTSEGESIQLLFADGSVRRYLSFDQNQITTRYDGPGLLTPEW